MSSKRRTYGRTCALYCIGYLLIFLVFYLPNYVVELPEKYIGTYLVFREIIERIVGFIIPTTAATAIFSAERNTGVGKRILRSVALAACSAVYDLPCYYLYMLSYGYDSAESIGLSMLMTVGDIIMRAVGILLLVILAEFVSCRMARRNVCEGEISDGGSARDSVSENMLGDYFDLTHPATAGILSIAIGQLAIFLISELYNTVTYLIEDAGMYGTGEIVYIMATYIGLLCMMVICHLLCVKIKNSICKLKEDEQWNT